MDSNACTYGLLTIKLPDKTQTRLNRMIIIKKEMKIMHPCIHRNLTIENQVKEVTKVKKGKLLVGAAIGSEGYEERIEKLKKGPDADLKGTKETIDLEQGKLKEIEVKLDDMTQRIQTNDKMFDAQQRIKQRFEEDLAKAVKDAEKNATDKLKMQVLSLIHI